MKYTKFNIAKPEKYIKDGVEKTYWANVGTMTVFEKDDGSVSRIMDIPAIGLKANIFPITPKENKQQTTQNDGGSQVPAESNGHAETMNPEDIPF